MWPFSQTHKAKTKSLVRPKHRLIRPWTFDLLAIFPFYQTELLPMEMNGPSLDKTGSLPIWVLPFLDFYGRLW